MRKLLVSGAMGVAMVMAASTAKAQVDLSAYADPEGFLDVQELTCAQLANTWQGDADRLTAWYSGWYNGLAKKHYMDIRKGKEAEHEVIVYCKANPEIKIIQAIDIVFKSMRERLGIKVQ
jgi:hypothetical protein